MKPFRFDIRGLSAKEIIKFAYNLPGDYGLPGIPRWAESDRFDVAATIADPDASRLGTMSAADLHLQIRFMLQSLLEDRLKLKVSFPQKDLPVFKVVVAKSGLKCINSTPEGEEGPIAPPPPNGGYLSKQPGQEMHWQAHSLPIRLILSWMREQPEVDGRTLIDRTGLNGHYNCDVTWAREGTEASGASFFTAIQKQMGLVLIPKRAMTETLAVDSIERPSQN